MKKLLIATTALVATAGMASADITISGHAAAGIYSGLDKAAAALNYGIQHLNSMLHCCRQQLCSYSYATMLQALLAAQCCRLLQLLQLLKLAAAVAAIGTYSADGIYSNAGVDFTMTGATDNGISFSASVNIDAGTEIDAGDFELDGADGGTAGLGAVSMTGAFGTLTFDDGGIDNLYSDATTADVSYSTTVGAVALTVAS